MTKLANIEAINLASTIFNALTEAGSDSFTSAEIGELLTDLTLSTYSIGGVDEEDRRARAVVADAIATLEAIEAARLDESVEATREALKLEQEEEESYMDLLNHPFPTI